MLFDYNRLISFTIHYLNNEAMNLVLIQPPSIAFHLLRTFQNNQTRARIVNENYSETD